MPDDKTLKLAADSLNSLKSRQLQSQSDVYVLAPGWEIRFDSSVDPNNPWIGVTPKGQLKSRFKTLDDAIRVMKVAVVNTRCAFFTYDDEKAFKVAYAAAAMVANVNTSARKAADDAVEAWDEIKRSQLIHD